MFDMAVVVSVIVLTYNQSEYIAKCLDSILSQKTTFEFEVLIGDDCSSDGTSIVVKEYARMFPDVIKAFIREKNMGATRNVYDLFNRAQGKYIASCEGDDYWTDPRKLEIQVGFLESHLEYMGCTHACCIVDEKGQPYPCQKLPWVCEKERFTLSDFKGIYLPGQPATLVHRNFFLDTRHDYSIIYKANPMIADRTIILILAAQGPIYRMKRTMSCYRREFVPRESNITHQMFTSNKKVNLMQLEFTRRLEQYAKKEFHILLNCWGIKFCQYIKYWVKQAVGSFKIGVKK